MKKRGVRGSLRVEFTVMGFVAGAAAMAFVDRGFPHPRLSPALSASRPADIVLPAAPKLVSASPADVVGNSPAPAPITSALDETEPVTELRTRHLELPVQSVARDALHDSFDETRGSTRSHEAIDIMAPRHTPILAVEDGVVARLFESKAGGTTVYQFDPSTRYVYYYAHLQRYADGLQEGGQVRRGQVLGYVGTSGNAPRDTPHLHFAIFWLTDKKQWWNGAPIDPYLVLK